MKQLNKILSAIRITDWWQYIIPPVLSFYTLGLLLTDTSKTALAIIILHFMYFMLLTSFTAAFGFYLNEWTDIKDDKTAGKKNNLEGASNLNKFTILGIILSGIIFLCLKTNWTIITFPLYIIQLSLFLLYSVPPIRLKRNKYAAVILDALYSGSLFYLLAILTTLSSEFIRPELAICIFLWGFCKGIRNIILHLIKDKKHDNLLAFDTIATANNTKILTTIIKNYLLPVEVFLFTLILLLLPYNIIFISFLMLFLVFTSSRKQYIIPFILKRKKTIKSSIYSDINLFYEITMPLLIVGLAAYKDNRLVFLLILSIFLFPNTLNWLKYFFRHLFKNKVSE